MNLNQPKISSQNPEMNRNVTIIKNIFLTYYSKNAKQKGNQEDGVRGFLINDIKWVLKEYKSKKCCYCQKTEATSMCHHAQCKKWFHYTYELITCFHELQIHEFFSRNFIFLLFYEVEFFDWDQTIEKNSNVTVCIHKNDTLQPFKRKQ